MQVKTLIDRAASKAGGYSALARELGQPPHRVFEWKAGSRPMPLEAQVRACVIAGIVGGELAAHVREVAGVPPEKPRRGRGGLRSLGSLAIGAAALAGSLGGPPGEPWSIATMYKRFTADRRKRSVPVEQERRCGSDRRLKPA